MKKKKIVLTGSSGYIGTHLRRYLENLGSFTVIEVSREYGYDLTIPGWTKNLETECSIVIHAAQSNLYRQFPEGSQDMVSVNINATAELLEWARLNQSVEHFIHLSTGNVYKAATHPVNEDHECSPASMYAATKYSAECLVKQYSAFYQTTIVRLFGVFGPKQKSMIIPTMIDRIKRGEPITLAQQKGVFLTPLYIDDCIQLLGNIIEETRYFPHVIYNMAGEKVLSLGDIVEIIASQLGVEPKLTITDASPQWFCGETKYPDMRIANGLHFADAIEKVLSTV